MLVGLTPRGITELFNILDRDSGKYTFAVSCYMLELYQDDLADLLLPASQKQQGPQKVDSCCLLPVPCRMHTRTDRHRQSLLQLLPDQCHCMQTQTDVHTHVWTVLLLSPACSVPWSSQLVVTRWAGQSSHMPQ